MTLEEPERAEKAKLLRKKYGYQIASQRSINSWEKAARKAGIETFWLLPVIYGNPHLILEGLKTRLKRGQSLEAKDVYEENSILYLEPVLVKQISEFW